MHRPGADQQGAVGEVQLMPGRFSLELSPGEARQLAWNDGHPDSLVETTRTGTHYLLREIVGAGGCRFEPVEHDDQDPNLRVHAIVTPDERVIGTLVTRLVLPEHTPRTFLDRAVRVTNKVIGWLINEKPTPELRIRVQANSAWNKA